MLKGQVDPEVVKRYRQVMLERAQQQELVVEMTEFLADYGLTWLGTPGEEDDVKDGKFNYQQIDKELGFQKPQYRNKLPAEIDTEVLTRRIEELNFIAEK